MTANVRGVADWEQVRTLALALPDTDERQPRRWRVHGKLFVLERPLRRSDLEELGDDAPDGPILGFRVEHLGAKQALLSDDPAIYFTTSHFDDFPMVLARLDRLAGGELRELIVEAWLARAPKRLARQYIDTHFETGDDDGV